MKQRKTRKLAASPHRLVSCAMSLLALVCISSAADQAAGEAAGGLPLRGIGPALMGGRIADIDVHPHEKNTWYVAVGSGGVWKTTNAGTTWQPVFDAEGSYSIGDVTIDPLNPDVVWVGTGENVSGRHVGWGDGVYKSVNGGQTWTNMGLQASEHIGNILVDPRDSDRVFVAAEGPLWSAGGDRGLYRTTDGGQTWEPVLQIDEDTGITDVEFHPGNPDVIYAAAYQRRRHVWGLMAGGPGGGIYKSTNGGDSWEKLSRGLPAGDVGKIGLAVTAANPRLVYATIEADDENKGFYRSEDQGESWKKTNAYISNGTGPHYYQEISASPLDSDLVIQMDVFFHVTRDGGKNFQVLGTGREKHSDNHALWIDPRNDRHLIAGSDAGLYESFDQGASWRHFPNLPVSQFYKVAVDNSEPFYNILGGTQDLGTLFGPSRTMTVEGVRNQDWYVPLGADGYGVAFDPEDGLTSYMEYQQGYLFRHRRDTNELVHIQPQPTPGEPPERWNWDTPILISPHDAGRIYTASQRVWRSDDRGNAWTAISGDLTTDQNRYELEFAGRVWSVDDLHDNGAMSKYATLTAITESPLSEGVLYVASDDGLIHATTDGGENWSQARPLPGLPERSFINDLEASLFNDETVFAVADAHKVGDFAPYVFVSSNSGRSWRAIAGDLPDGTIAWAIQQDHENEDLLFLGTEFGLYFTLNGGENWHKLSGAPTIAFRDIKIQRRDNDVIGATFGRGIYILDDYSALRVMARAEFGENTTLFPIRDAWWYVPSVPMQAAGMPTLGSDSFRAPNPDFGALITYYLDQPYRSLKEERLEAEQSARADRLDIPFPGWDRLRAESREPGPRLMMLIRDETGAPVRWLKVNNEKGTHRISWDLRYPAPNPVDLNPPAFTPPWAGTPQGPLVAPGVYSAQLIAITREEATALGEPQDFKVKPVREASPGSDYRAIAEFQLEVSELMRDIMRTGSELSQAQERLKKMKAAALAAPRAEMTLFQRLDALEVKLLKMQAQLSGDPVRRGLNESTAPSISGRAYNASNAWYNTQTATQTQRSDFERARSDYAGLSANLDKLLETEWARLKSDLEHAGAPGWR